MNTLQNSVISSMKMIEDMSNRWGHVWKDGTPMSSLKYACAEAGEVIDAELRLERANDSRNNSKEILVEDELVDVWMMLNKFLFNVYKDSGLTVDKFVEKLDLRHYEHLNGSGAEIMLDVSGLTVIISSVFDEMNSLSGTLSLGVEISIVMSRLMDRILSYNVDPVDGLAKTLRRIEEKQYVKGFTPR